MSDPIKQKKIEEVELYLARKLSLINETELAIEYVESLRDIYTNRLENLKKELKVSKDMYEHDKNNHENWLKQQSENKG